MRLQTAALLRGFRGFWGAVSPELAS